MLSISLRSEADAIKWCELHIYSLYFSIAIGFIIFWWFLILDDKLLSKLKYRIIQNEYGYRWLSDICEKQDGALRHTQEQIRWCKKKLEDRENGGTEMGEGASQAASDSEDDDDECASVSSRGSEASTVSTKKKPDKTYHVTLNSEGKAVRAYWVIGEDLNKENTTLDRDASPLKTTTETEEDEGGYSV